MPLAEPPQFKPVMQVSPSIWVWEWRLIAFDCRFIPGKLCLPKRRGVYDLNILEIKVLGAEKTLGWSPRFGFIVVVDRLAVVPCTVIAMQL